MGKATAAVAIHAGNNEGDMGNSGELPPASISALVDTLFYNPHLTSHGG